MSGRVFLDTNILIYGVDKLGPDRKRQIAASLVLSALEQRNGVISYQVVQEFFSTCLKKAIKPITQDGMAEYLNSVLKPLLAVHSSIELFREGIDILHRHKLSWYDSLIVAAAVEAGCSVLYTEDMHHGAKICGVRIENPFL